MSIGVLNNPVNLSSSQATERWRLLADIGGTNARFAVETAAGEIMHIRSYRCADYLGVVPVIQAYFSEMQLRNVEHAAIAIANPVDGDHVKMTNRDWHFSIEAARHTLKLRTLLVVNDFTALAMALPKLSETQCVQVGAGTPRSNSALGLIGPGTGLGVSGLMPALQDSVTQEWIPLASEGGHVSFAPFDQREEYILQYARQYWPHVSFERVASGSGIALIYRALAARMQQSVSSEIGPAEIEQRALSSESLAIETLDCFCGILGNFAGNLACTLGALGGVYIGGGIVPRMRDFFVNSSFRTRFEAKGRFASYLAQIPTYLITAQYPTLLGVSALLAQKLK